MAVDGGSDQEQRVARRLARDAAVVRTGKRTAEGPPKFTAGEAERAFCKTQHQALREFTLG
jgi:hypothetical protein